MNQLVLLVSDDEMELLYNEVSRHADINGDEQSEEMEALGEKIRTAIEELE